MIGRFLFAEIGVYTTFGGALAQYSAEEREQQLEDRQQEFEWRQQLNEWNAWDAQRRMDDLEWRQRNRENDWELQRLLERRW